MPYDRLPYDRLIVAAGSTDFYFGHEAWAEHAPGLKSLGQALHIRNRMLLAFEEAERTTEAALRDALLTFVVVGAGPTGVELAGALSEIARQTLARDFRHIHAASARVVLIEAGPRVLLTFDEGLSRTALRSLQKLGTEVLQSSKVIDIDREGVTIEVGGTTQKIQCRTIIWAAGVRASPLGTMVGGTLDHSGRVLVRPDLTVPDRPEISVIGDLAAATSEGRPVPGLAPAAMQEGKHAARNLLRALENKPTEPFRYRDKGSLATIGRGDAVGQIGKLRFSGLLAWVAWVFVHILYLIGFRNRYVVLTEWAFSYLNHDRGARLITTAGEEDAIHPATHLRSTAAPPTKPDTTLGAPPG